MSRNIPFQAVKLAEECSKFSRQAGLSAARVVYSYRTVRCSDSVWHILSCVRDAGTDYSGRTNHLAQHLMFDSREASACAREGKTPAGVILGTAWLDHDGFCGWIADGVHWDAHEPEPTWQWWQAYSGSGDCRKNLSSEAALRGAVLVYGGGLESQTEEDAKKVLFLYAESQADCPDHGWGVTFTTSLEPNDELSEFRWIGVAEDSPMLPKVEVTGGRTRITFDTPAPAPRLLESTGSCSEVRAPDASQSAVLQQQNYGMAGEGDGSKVQRSGVKPPPLGPRIPPRHVPRVPERAVLGWLTDYWKPLAFAAGLLLAASAAYILLFPPPPQIEFIKTTLPAYTGEPVQLEIRTIPPGREHEVKIEPPSIDKAGKTKVTASIDGKWLGVGTNVTQYITIPKKPANIKFDPRSLKQVWPSNQVNQVLFSVEPEKDEGTGESLGSKVKLLYKSESQDESAWSEAKPRPTGNQTNFDVMARISADANYAGEKRARLVITRQDDNKPALENTSAESGKTLGQTNLPPKVPSVRFLLADKSQLLSILKLLPDPMPKGDLTVERCDDSSISAKIDRGTGGWAQESSPDETTSGLAPTLFEMEAGIPTKKTPKKPSAPDLDGPLTYVVMDDKILSFVAIELVPGDNSSVMQRFFRRVHLGTMQGKPLIQFNLKAGGQRVNLDQFITQQKGERFVLEITDPPYNEQTPLELYFAPNGELVTTKQLEQLQKDLSSIAKEEAVQAAARTPWDQKRGELVKPLSRTVPDPRAEALIKAIGGIAQPAQPAESVVQTNGTLLVSTLVAETFKVLESDSLTSTLIRLSRDRAKKKEDSKSPGAGVESLRAILDVSLLTPHEWQERIQSSTSSPEVWKQKAIEWVKGRESDVQKNEGEKRDKRLVQEMLEGIRLSIEGLSDQVSVRSGQEKSIKREAKIQNKLNFLKSLGSQPSPELSGKQGRLLLVTEKPQAGVASTNILWPNVLLFGDPVQEAIKNDPQ